MTNVVLDTSAVVTWLHQESGWEAVDRAFAMQDCCMSAVNLAELVAKSTERISDHDVIRAMIAELPFEVAPLDEAQAFAAGLLRPATRHLDLSLGDRACLALAMSRDALALTADRVWLDLDIGVRVECLR